MFIKITAMTIRTTISKTQISLAVFDPSVIPVSPESSLSPTQRSSAFAEANSNLVFPINNLMS